MTRLRGKENCLECHTLPEGEVIRGHDHTNNFDIFIRQGKNHFTDDQLDFLADWLEISDGSEYKK